MTMVERVARAILKARFYDPEPDMYGHDLERFHREMDPDQADEAKREARSAILAIREPSEKMVDSGVAFALNVSIGREYNWSTYVADKHRAMIDAALEEGK